MLKKKEKVFKGKQIKREAGIPHAIAMHLGKMWVTDGYISERMSKAYPQYVRYQPAGRRCHGRGRGGGYNAIVGPAGEISSAT